MRRIRFSQNLQVVACHASHLTLVHAAIFNVLYGCCLGLSNVILDEIQTLCNNMSDCVTFAKIMVTTIVKILADAMIIIFTLWPKTDTGQF